MQKIINQLGTAQYNPFRKVVEVRFKNFGELSAYHETLDLSLYIATTLKVKKWLLVKNSFSDINPAEFLQVLKVWLYKHRKDLKNNRISLLTKRFEKKQIQNLLQFNHLPINIFCNETVAYQDLEDKSYFLEKSQVNT